MSLTLRSTRQADLIVANLRKVFATGEISHLTNASYKFLYLCSGFIAHYNLHGFQCEYSNVNDLKAQLARNYRANQWRNFTPNDRDYAYMMQKRDIYNRICALFTDEGYTMNPTLASILANLSYEELLAVNEHLSALLYAKNPEILAENKRRAEIEAERQAEEAKRDAYEKKVITALSQQLKPGTMLKMKGCRDRSGIREFTHWGEDGTLICWQIKKGVRSNQVTTHMPDKVVSVLIDGKAVPIRKLLS